MSFYVYIIANRPAGALYIDVTRDLLRRGCDRRERAQAGFSLRAGAPRLVYYEEFPTVLEALVREKVIRACSRGWKIRHIEHMNPDWRDLARDLSRDPAREVSRMAPSTAPRMAEVVVLAPHAGGKRLNLPQTPAPNSTDAPPRLPSRRPPEHPSEHPSRHKHRPRPGHRPLRHPASQASDA